MTDRIPIGRLYPNHLPLAMPRKVTTDASSQPPLNQSFKDVLQDKLVKFSHHAEVRLQQRGIHLHTEQLAKLESAIDKVAAKGAKESLILFKDMALIVNVKSRTVVTAMDGASVENNVFTKIDSAVIIS